MGVLKKAFFHEHKQFQKLSTGGQKLLLSLFLYSLINPIFQIFINAFIWRQTQDVILVALFNLSWMSIIPLGFYINGLLLKRYSVKRMYFLGAVIRSALVALLIFFPAINPMQIVLFGLGYGFTSAIFFSNRNLLVLELTNSSNRIYFQSLDFISQTVSNIFVPLVIGSLIIFGTDLTLYTPQEAYYAIAIGMILFSLLMGIFVNKITIKTPDISNIVLHHGSQRWNFARGIHFLMGLLSGITLFLPVLIILSNVGQEDSLGQIQSITAVICSLVLYGTARTINTRFRIQMILMSILAMIVGSSLLAFYFNPVGIFVYFGLMTLTHQMLMVQTNSLILDVIDEENTAYDHKYKYIFDLELVLNVGRVTGIMFFACYIKLFTQDFAMQYTSLFVSIALIAIIILAKTIEENKVLQTSTHDLAESYAHDQTHK